jgi:hypothetical protein
MVTCCRRYQEHDLGNKQLVQHLRLAVVMVDSSSLSSPVSAVALHVGLLVVAV